MSDIIIGSIEEGIYSSGSIQVRAMVDEPSQPTILDTMISPYVPRDIRIVNTLINTLISGTGDIGSTIELHQDNQIPFDTPIATTTVNAWGDFEMKVPLGTIADNTTYYLRMIKGGMESVSPLTRSTLASPSAEYKFFNGYSQPLVVDVTRLEGLTYQYSIDGGKNWNSLLVSQFTLDEGVYMEGDVQVIAISDSAVSAPTIMPPIISPYLLVADELQIDADRKNYIFSGRAAPGSTINIRPGTLTSGEVVASGTADECGNYRIVLDSTELNGRVRAFTLHMAGIMPTNPTTTQSIPDLDYPTGWVVSFREERIFQNPFIRYAVLGPKQEGTGDDERDINYRLIWHHDGTSSMTPYRYYSGTIPNNNNNSQLYVDNINVGYMMNADPVVARASRYLLRTELDSSNYIIVIPYPRDLPQEGIVAVEGWNPILPIRAAVRDTWDMTTLTITYPASEFPIGLSTYTFYVRAAGRNISRSIQYRLDILTPESDRGLYAGNDQNRDLVIYLTKFNSSESDVSSINIEFTGIKSTPDINPPIDAWELLPPSSSSDYTITRPVPGTNNGIAKIVIAHGKVLDYIRDNTDSDSGSYVINTIDMDITITADELAEYSGEARMNSIQTTITIQ